MLIAARARTGRRPGPELTTPRRPETTSAHPIRTVRVGTRGYVMTITFEPGVRLRMIFELISTGPSVGLERLGSGEKRREPARAIRAGQRWFRGTAPWPERGGRTSRFVSRILCLGLGLKRRPSILACRCRQAPAAYPQARTGRPRAPAQEPCGSLLALLRVGFT